MYDDTHPTHDQLLWLVTKAASRFRHKPTNEFLGEVVALLEKTMTVKEAEHMLLAMPLEFDIFPSLAQLEHYRQRFKQAKAPNLNASRHDLWVSKQAPGTPASVEALFLMIKHGQTASGGFRIGQAFVQMTDDELFKFYEAWASGEVHPELQEHMKRIRK